MKASEIISTIIVTIIGFTIPAILGYLVAVIKNYRKKDKNQEEALKCLLRSNITSKYYVYSELGEIPCYEKENIDYMFEQYKKMGGNSYVCSIVEKLDSLKIRKWFYLGGKINEYKNDDFKKLEKLVISKHKNDNGVLLQRKLNNW